jgi:bifunctional enzyme CysN/CysC/sulfate adenylyltransferase subunit 1
VIPAADLELKDGFASFLRQDLNKELLRFTTAGSVDDGKSTLIGRLLHDSKSVYEDQLASVKKSRINRSSGPIDFSLLTDGLRAEREQGITIDVAYRYFATPHRKFIIADTPGHEEYTRNMATGASTADLAVILIDGTKGLLPQTRRHAYIASLLGIPNVLAAVNKMDLVEYREDTFLNLQRDFIALAGQLGISSVLAVPISALEGDNVVSRSERMPWYEGPTFLEHLETTPVRPDAAMEAVRFPVQCVIRPDAGFRGFAGQVASGAIRPGDPIVALPSGQKTRVRSIVTYDGELTEAFHPMSVTLRLEDEIDLSRGDMLVSPHAPPDVSRHFQAMMIWLHHKPFKAGQNYVLKHTVRSMRAKATQIRHRVNISTFAKEPAQLLEMNDIAAVEFESTGPLFFDPYSRNRTTGSFILIDPISNATVGAAMIQENLSGVSASPGERESSPGNVVATSVAAGERQARHGHHPALVLVENRRVFAGLLERALFLQGLEVLLVTDHQENPEKLAGFLAIARSAGLILIYASSALDSHVKSVLSTSAGKNFLDLAAADLPADDHDAILKVLPRIESLRIRGEVGEQGKVN